MKCFLLLLLCGSMIGCSNVADVRETTLKRTPVTTSLDDVLKQCAELKLTCRSSKTAGYLNQDTGKVIGTSSIWALVEESKKFLFIRSTMVYWGFDGQGKLIDVWVWQTTDAP